MFDDATDNNLKEIRDKIRIKHKAFEIAMQDDIDIMDIPKEYHPAIRILLRLYYVKGKNA